MALPINHDHWFPARPDAAFREDLSTPERLVIENREPGRLADRGFRTGGDANIVEILRREPVVRKLIPVKHRQDGIGSEADREVL